VLRHLGLAALLLAATGLNAFAANITLVINGKATSVPVIESNGKAYIDATALAQYLGWKATYESANAKLYVNTAPVAGGTTTAAADTGIPQMPGPDATIGQVYKLGVGNPTYFRLTSAEFTTHPVVIGAALYTQTAKEKLLLLKFTVQNPQKQDMFVRGDSLKFTAVDAKNVNHQGVDDWGDQGNKSQISMSLKPAQTVELYTVVVVPAAGRVPKLIVQMAGEDNAPVLRYDLRDKVPGLQPPVADPQDDSGATALEEVPAQLGTAYPCESFDVTVEKYEYSTATLEGQTPEEGERFLVATLLMKNNSPTDLFMRYDTLAPVLTSTDGNELKYVGMLAAGGTQGFAQNVKGEAQVRVRLYFTVPKDATPKTLAIREGESRSYLYEVKVDE
jgi:hypothetical protein